jgi:hypothetical protein
MAWRNYGTKYKAKKTVLDGITFDSKKEADRYTELKFLLKSGEIQDLQMQVEYELLPNQYGPDIVTPRGKTKRGPLLERAVKYKADFVYTENGVTVVEDVKGFRTKEYIIKRKLLLWRYGIQIKEV